MQTPEYVSVKEAAAVAAVTERVIRSALDQGHLKGYRPTPRNTRVNIADLHRWMRRYHYHDQVASSP